VGVRISLGALLEYQEDDVREDGTRLKPEPSDFVPPLAPQAREHGEHAAM
jgi:hypothetical protein